MRSQATCPQRPQPALLVLSLSRHTSAAPALGYVGRWPRAHSLRSDQLLPEAAVLPLCLPQATPHPCPVSSSDPAAPALRPCQLHGKSQRRETSTALRSQADAALTVGQTHRREALFPDSRLFCIFRHEQKIMGWKHVSLLYRRNTSAQTCLLPARRWGVGGVGGSECCRGRGTGTAA